MLAVPSAVCPIPTAHTYADVKAAFDKAKKNMPGLTPAAWRKAAAQDLGIDYDTFLSIWKTKGKVPLVPSPSLTPTAASQASKVDMDLLGSKSKNVAEPKPAATPGSATADAEALAAKLPDPVPATGGAADAVPGVLTPHGPLTNNLAKQFYNAAKKDMPGGTPAQWRKAAAQNLGVDYNDFLKAWKLKPGAKQAIKLADVPATPTTVSPSTVGKYSTSDISADELKGELANLYGPNANKSYINLDFDNKTGSYIVQFPNSLLPTQAAKDAVAQGLKDLGLKVEKKGNDYLITPGKPRIKIPKTTGETASDMASVTTKLPDGTNVIDAYSSTTKKWVGDWWDGLSQLEKTAWKKYTNGYYRDINRYWRDGIAPTPPPTVGEIEKWSEAISRTMITTTEEITTFRGTNIDIEQFIAGGLWSDQGFMSTAVSKSRSWSGVKFEIVCPPGSRGMYIDPFSSHQGELEFLLDQGSMFRILEVDKANKTVKMVLVPMKG